MQLQLSGNDVDRLRSQEHSWSLSAATFLPLVGCTLTLVVFVFSLLWNRFQKLARARHKQAGSDRIKTNGCTEEHIEGSSHRITSTDSQDIETSSIISVGNSIHPAWALEISPFVYPVLVAEIICGAGQVAIYLIVILSDNRSPILHDSVAVVCRVYGLLLALTASLRMWMRRQLEIELWLFRPLTYGLLLIGEILQCFGGHNNQDWPNLFKLRASDLALLLLSIVLSINVPRRGRLRSHLTDVETKSSPELCATILSALSIGWINPFIWQSTGQSYELSDLYHFIDETRSFFILESYRMRKYKGDLAHNLLCFNGSYLSLQGCWAILSAVLTFAPVLLFQEILSYVEQPAKVRERELWLYVILLLILGVGKSLADGQAAWTGIKVYVRTRGVLAGEIFSKALRRSLVNHSNDKETHSTGSGSRTSSQAVTRSGHVINLLSSDTSNIAEMGNSLCLLLVVVPIEFLIGMVLLYKILGYSSFVGLAVMVALVPINILLARQMSTLQKGVMGLQSDRISRVEEMLLSIRAIKFQAWEAFFKIKVDRAREAELTHRNKAFALQSLMVAVYNTTPLLISIVSFLCYTLVARRELRASIAFPALSLFALIRGPLDKFADVLAKVIQARLSAGRIDDYLHEPDQSPSSLSPLSLMLSGAASPGGKCFAWNDHGKDEQFNLSVPKINFKENKLNVVIGPTASGKSSLLLALLGEMYLQTQPDQSEQVSVAGRESTGREVRVAYCAQDAWLVNDTIRENILFGNIFKPDRYNEVISCCSLEKDLEILSLGDSTIVGEKGILLSGGQKQRVSLARALYSDADVLLLDDCFSAVDAETGRWIFRRAIKGPLTTDRTCILATHNVDLCVKSSDHAILLEDGEITIQGPPSTITSEDKLVKMLKASDSHVGSEQEETPVKATSSELNSAENVTTEQVIKEPVQSPQDSEQRKIGTIKLHLFKFYFTRMGSWPYWIGTVAMLLVNQLSGVANSLWIREWANAYQQYRNRYASHAFSHSHFQLIESTDRKQLDWVQYHDPVNVVYYLWVYVLLIIVFFFIKIIRMQVLFRGLISASRRIHTQLLDAIVGTNFAFFDRTPHGRIVNRMTRDMTVIDQALAPVMLGLQHAVFSAVTIWIIIAVVTPIFILPGLLVVLCYYYLTWSFLRSSRELKRLEAIQSSPIFQYLGETLSGFVTIRAYGQQERFMRNFACAVDDHTRPFMHVWASNIWLTLRVEALSSLVATLSAAFIVFNARNLDPGAAGLSLTYAVTFTEHVLWFVRCYSMTEQNMNSVERVEEYVSLPQEEPKPVEQEAISVPDAWPSRGRMSFSNVWMRYADHLPFVLKDIHLDIRPKQRVAIVGRTGAGKSSLSLALLRAVEASSGSIIIDDVDISKIPLARLRSSISYIPQDPTIFSGSLRINLDPFDEFTDRELLHVLRQVRFLKPDSSAQGAIVLSTLLTDNSGNSGGESINTDANGSDSNDTLKFGDIGDTPQRTMTLSSGQRQLICLARALLKRPKILIMDEATASIDYETDSQIQKVLRHDLGQSPSWQSVHGINDDVDGSGGDQGETTVITIAHRLRTIIDYDRVIVLDKGEVVEDGEPWTLLQDDGTNLDQSCGRGAFSSICRQTEDFEELRIHAREAWKRRRSGIA